MTDRLCLLEAQDDDTSIVRGRIGGVLAQFDWAVLTGDGAIIPTQKSAIAIASLQAAGWRVDRRRGVSPKLPQIGAGDALPMCSNAICRQPYRRGKIPRPDERCVRCELELSLDEMFHRRCTGGLGCHNPRQPCEPGHGITVVDYRPYDALASLAR